MKLFLKKPEQSQGLVQKVLQAATATNDNPDIRDRAYVYWRLLSSDPEITKVRQAQPLLSTILIGSQNVVLSEKPPITSTIQSLPPALLDTLIGELSTLASVYHKPPETFLGQGRFGAEAMQKAAIEYITVLRLSSPYADIYTENNKNSPSRIPSLPEQWQQQYQALLDLKAIPKICWTSTLMEPLRHRCRSRRQEGRQVLKALLGRRRELRHQQWKRHKLLTIWTT